MVGWCDGASVLGGPTNLDNSVKLTISQFVFKNSFEDKITISISQCDKLFLSV